jgi:glutamate 5-kinase
MSNLESNQHSNAAASWDDAVLARLRSARRVVIKFGTNIVIDPNGEFSTARLQNIISSIARLKQNGRQVVLVSSGAVGLGAGKLQLNRSRLNDVVMRQACAAVGQSMLMHMYEELFETHGVNIAQVLLTEGDFTNRSRYTNLQRTVEQLLKLGVVPIINENDTVSIAELEYEGEQQHRVFSDNDRLAALVMSKLDADLLILLTSIEGVYERMGEPGARRIPLITEITPQLRALAAGPAQGGRGGMKTKLEAAEIAMRAGGMAVIADGRENGTLERIFSGIETGTLFIPGKRIRGKQRWIAYAAGIRGGLVVNDGARDAILGGSASLLASGVISVKHEFDSKDVVSIIDAHGREFARGISNCTSREAKVLIEAGAGKPEDSRSESKREKSTILISRDNIVLLEL